MTGSVSLLRRHLLVSRPQKSSILPTATLELATTFSSGPWHCRRQKKPKKKPKKGRKKKKKNKQKQQCAPSALQSVEKVLEPTKKKAKGIN